jgi:hypothetical protein
MTLQDIRTKIHQYFLESEKEGLESQKVRTRGNYPNTILLTKEQYISLVKEMFKISEHTGDSILLEIKILAIEGLEVIFTDHIEEPKILKIDKINQ